MKKIFIMITIPLLIASAVFLLLPKDPYADYENATFSAG